MSAPRPFRFGVGPAGLLGAAADGWSETVREYERLGYATVCLGDHLSMMGPLPALAAAGAASERIGLGLMVAGNDYRQPLLLAQDAATVQALSGGRLELGIGAGWDQADYRQLGIEMERPGARIERLAEAVAIVKRYLASGVVGCGADAATSGAANGAGGSRANGGGANGAGGPAEGGEAGGAPGEHFSFHGEHYRLEDVAPCPVPLSAPPRLMIGGGGPRVLALAAREADIVGINVPLRGADVRDSIAAGDTAAARVEAAVAGIRAAAGARFDEIELHVNVLFCAVSDDPEPRLAKAAERLAVPVAELEDSPFVLVGGEAELEAKLRRLRERLGISYFTVDAAAAEPFAPVVRRLTGT